MAVLPSFETGGTAWFTNLAIADPMYIMPLLSGATFLATVEVRTWRANAWGGTDLQHLLRPRLVRRRGWHARQPGCEQREVGPARTRRRSCAHHRLVSAGPLHQPHVHARVCAHSPYRLARACSSIGSRPTRSHSFRRLARLSREAAFRLLNLTRGIAVFKWQPLRRAVGIPDTSHLAQTTSGLPQHRPAVPPAGLLLNKPRPPPRV